MEEDISAMLSYSASSLIQAATKRSWQNSNYVLVTETAGQQRGTVVVTLLVVVYHIVWPAPSARNQMIFSFILIQPSARRKLQLFRTVDICSTISFKNRKKSRIRCSTIQNGKGSWRLSKYSMTHKKKLTKWRLTFGWSVEWQEKEQKNEQQLARGVTRISLGTIVTTVATNKFSWFDYNKPAIVTIHVLYSVIERWNRPWPKNFQPENTRILQPELSKVHYWVHYNPQCRML